MVRICGDYMEMISLLSYLGYDVKLSYQERFDGLTILVVRLLDRLFGEKPIAYEQVLEITKEICVELDLEKRIRRLVKHMLELHRK